MANPPQRPPWFREPPRKEKPAASTTAEPNPSATPASGQAAQPFSSPPLTPQSAQPAPASPSHPSAPSTPPLIQSAEAGRFPMRPELPGAETPRTEIPRAETPRAEAPRAEAPRAEVPRAEALRQDPAREHSLETRMLALEHDYGRSSENWRESSLAMVRALEILESRIGSQTGQPLGGMGEGEISNQLAALRAEVAKLRNRIEGLLPPPSDQNFAQSGQGRGRGFAPRRFNLGRGAQQGAYIPPKLAKVGRSAGRGFLSLLITITAIILAWYAATYIDDTRSASIPQGFYNLLKKDIPATPPKTKGEEKKSPTSSLEHYMQGFSLYHLYKRTNDDSYLSKAVPHFRAASDQGMAAAQFWLAHFYEKGKGLEFSPQHAERFYRQAAAMGHVKAMHNLGMMYLEGRGVEQDVASASEWLLKAAAYGSADSMTQLGLINEEGMLGARNIIHAYAWYKLAAQLGDASAIQHAPRLAISLSRRNRSEASALINSWRVRAADPFVNGNIASMRRSHASAQAITSRNKMP